MASYSVAQAKHATLGASTADTVTFTDSNTGGLQIINRGAADIYFRVGISGGTATTPTAAGANDDLICRSGLSVNFAGVGSPVTSVKLISTGATAYSVQVM